MTYNAGKILHFRMWYCDSAVGLECFRGAADHERFDIVLHKMRAQENKREICIRTCPVFFDQKGVVGGLISEAYALEFRHQLQKIFLCRL